MCVYISLSKGDIDTQIVFVCPTLEISLFQIPCFTSRDQQVMLMMSDCACSTVTSPVS